MSLKKISWVIVVAMGLFHVVGGTAGADDVHVDGNATCTGTDCNGQTWCTAYLTLDEALAAAVPIFDTILVADGIYTPDPAGLADSRGATFALRSRVEIYGGHAGCDAIEPDARDPRRFETILSGDLDGDDTDPAGDNSENCYHVVTGSGTNQSAVLDGVTITAGNASGLTRSFEDVGGGLFNLNGGPTLRGCTITGNVGKRVGGIYNLSSDLVLEDCSIIGNRSGGNAGGLMDITSGFEYGATLSNCLILDNVAAGGFGGGIYTNEANTRVDNCTLYGNSAVAWGGGIHAEVSDPEITNSILWANEDDDGTGELSQVRGLNGTPVLDYCCVQGWTGDLTGDFSFGDDPLFVPGPAGCFYLGQEAAGQPANSPCWNTGDPLAAGFGATVTTRSDEGQDVGTVDIGFHYPVTGDVLVMGDMDRNGEVTLDDYAEWFPQPPDVCFTGPDAADLLPCCRIFDFDFDQDVDLFDYAEFAVALDRP